MVSRNFRLAIFLSVAVSLFSAGCGGTSSSTTNPAPTITSVTPGFIKAGSASQNLTLTGSNFLPTTTVTIAGVLHPVTYLGSSSLQLSLSAAELLAVGTVRIVLSNPAPGGGDATVDIPIFGSLAAFPSQSVDAYRPPASAPAYYINAVTGNDNSNGRSPVAAWKTLDRLHNQILKPGDVVRLARGSVWENQNLFFDNGSAGSAAAPVVIEAYGAGEPPTISKPRALWDKTQEMPGVVFGRDQNVAIPSSYITLLDLRIQDVVATSAISMTAETHHLVIAGNEVLRSGMGIGVHGQHQKVISNYVHDGVMAVDTGNPDVDWGANGVGVVGRDIEIAWNRFVNCSAPSKSFGQDGGAVEFFGNEPTTADPPGWAYVSDNIRIHHNFVDHADGFMESTGSVTNMLIAYNIYINSITEALEFHMDDPVYVHTYDARIENNTFVSRMDTTPYGWGIIGLLVQNTDSPPNLSANHITFRNNIFVTNYAIVAFKNVLGANLIHDHNIYQFYGNGKLTGDTAGFKLGSTEFIVDPQFVDYANQDLRLKPASPAINAGVVASYATDVLQTTVPTGNAPDIGAYEYK
jgi:hypothetical protein